MEKIIKNLSNRVTSNPDEWFWTVADDNQVTKYSTNKNGEGIFELNSDGVEVGQIAGLSQFSLCGVSNSTARSRIKRYFE